MIPSWSAPNPQPGSVLRPTLLQLGCTTPRHREGQAKCGRRRQNAWEKMGYMVPVPFLAPIFLRASVMVRAHTFRITSSVMRSLGGFGGRPRRVGVRCRWVRSSKARVNSAGPSGRPLCVHRRIAGSSSPAGADSCLWESAIPKGRSGISAADPSALWTHPPKNRTSSLTTATRWES